ncbi:M20/M25/M40 family metallo-hydrolase [Streptomyces sp. NBC_01551]|uniref:M20/M25/M40 family metallo-hydrolase n=1 Tax=Streptomyces sp. NBC_01551 TaxID=2975876 RepID=UPI0022511742|nr:M20/M25/M40 family metallo-hydrolase [Streptomyces sp. NBC_01551]MCX4528950.1 M20/M25/M40 family metallo-hydrolase [Streptomyces sp. NBC_01551]
MEGLRADLERLAAIPSIAFPGHPAEPVQEAHDLVVSLLREAGVPTVERIDLPGTAPVVYGDIPPPEPDAPTVLLYGHYDVQPAGDESLWLSPPFVPTPVPGGLRARGIADDKSNLIAYLGMLRLYEGRPPVGIKLVVEGQEEYGSVFDAFPPTDPARFACDAMVIADLGNLRPGTPTLTTGLRGACEVMVEVRTLAEPRHSGEFGGAAPDALLVLLHALATLHDARGDVAVPGLRREPWEGTTYTDEEFRDLASVHDDLPLLGSGSLGERLWSGPAITVIGLDAPGVEQAASAVVPYARAKLNLRFHPLQDPHEARERLVDHLLAQRPFGIPLTVTPGDTGPGFEARTGGPAYRAALTALKEAWGTEASYVATGGSIPLVNGLAKAAPEAEVLLFGAQDSMCNLHAPNERVLLSELRNTVVAMAAFLREYAADYRAARPAPAQDPR